MKIDNRERDTFKLKVFENIRFRIPTDRSEFFSSVVLQEENIETLTSIVRDSVIILSHNSLPVESAVLMYQHLR